MKNFIIKNKKEIIQITKWSSILLIIISLFMLTIGFYRTTGWGFDTWETSSQTNLLSFQTSTAQKGAGPLQDHILQFAISFLGGGALGLAGSLLQKITKNKLAEISILGIGSLNILFIYIYITLLGPKVFSGSTTKILMPIFLIIVSFLGTIVIWAISRSKKANKNTFVIVGIASQLFIEALSVVIINPNKIMKTDEGKQIWGQIQGYTLGKIRNTSNIEGTNKVEWWLIIFAMVIILFILIFAIFLRKKIDTYEINEEIAKTSGINNNWLRLKIYLLIALLAGVSSAILGTVALLGIIAPSISRLLFKNKATPIFISSFLIGGIMVSFAAFLSMNIELKIPVGILSTAIVVPYFIILMAKEK